MNAPGVFMTWKCESTTHTRLWPKSAAYSAGRWWKNPIARPLKIAPGTTSLVRTFIWIGLVSVQAEMVPASESKMNLAGTRPMLVRSLNPFEALNTWPVGAPLGTVNTSGAMLNGVPAVPPAYSVARPVPLSATHSGVVGPAARPHGLTRLGSVSCATPGMSLTRLVWRYPWCIADAPAVPPPASAATAVVASAITAASLRRRDRSGRLICSPIRRRAEHSMRAVDGAGYCDRGGSDWSDVTRITLQMLRPRRALGARRDARFGSARSGNAETGPYQSAMGGQL